MYIYLVPIIVISIVLFYLMYRHQKKLKNQYNQIKNDLYQSQTLPHILNTLSQNVFKNIALFASDNNILYIAHQLDSNYLSAPIRWGIQKTKQQIREDLQLFFGVIEWMEQQK